MLKLNSNDKVLILGVFNIRNIDWILSPSGILNSCNVTGDKALKLINTLNVCGLRQISSILNCDLKILDLVLSTEDLDIVSVTRSPSGLVPIDKYHPPTTITLNLTVNYLEEIEHRKLNYRKANYQLLSESISNDCAITDCAIAQFYETINDIIRNHVPP